ncbi:hypothetical protein ACLUWM_09435 [Limosilactobacillus mucosae]
MALLSSSTSHCFSVKLLIGFVNPRKVRVFTENQVNGVLLGHKFIDFTWIDSAIEVYEEESLFFKLSPLWYFNEPQILLSIMEKFLQNPSQKNTYELMDDPTVEFSFDYEYDGMILRLYRSCQPPSTLADGG